MITAWTHHEGDHDREPVADLIGGLDQDDGEADGHADHPAQEGSGSHQRKGPRIDVVQADVAEEGQRQEGALGLGGG